MIEGWQQTIVLRAFDDHGTALAAADAAGVSPATAQKLLRRYGRRLKRGLKVGATGHTLADREEALAALRDGETLADVGKRFGISRQAVHGWVKAAGLIVPRTKTKPPPKKRAVGGAAAREQALARSAAAASQPARATQPSAPRPGASKAAAALTDGRIMTGRHGVSLARSAAL
jgi:hypothetical protein